MPSRNGLLRHVTVVIVVLILTFAGSGSAWADGRVRYEPPTGATPTPTVVVAPAPGESPASDGADSGGDAAGGAAAVISAPAVEDEPVPQSNVRPKPDSRPIAVATESPAPTQTPTEAGPPKNPRLDEPVLRWLPEILAAAKDSGTPPEIIAGVMRLESNGDPRIISPVGARGLMQIMPDNLLAMGVTEDFWHDPATNVMAGGRYLAAQAAGTGSWESAVGAYFGYGCDVFGTCTETYIAVAFSWAAYYAPAIADPLNSGYALLPADWSYGEIIPFVEAAPPPVETPPAARPTPTATPTGTPTGTPTPGDGGTVAPTPAPTETPDVGGNPTEVPTEVPTEEPTEDPGIPPTDVPTEVPVEVPTDPPVESGGETPPPTEEQPAGG